MAIPIVVGMSFDKMQHSFIILNKILQPNRNKVFSFYYYYYYIRVLIGVCSLLTFLGKNK